MIFSRMLSLVEYLPRGWFIKLAVLRLMAQWRSLLTIIVGVMLASMTGASVSLYTNAVAQIGLVQRLDQQPREAVHVHSRMTLDASVEGGFDARWQTLDETARMTIDEVFAPFAGWVAQVVTWGETSDVILAREDTDGQLRDVEGVRVRVGAYEGIADAVMVVDGVLPSNDIADDIDLQVAVSERTAQLLDLAVGDRIVLDQRGWDSSIPMHAEVVGVLAPRDEDSAYWMSPAPLRIDNTRADRIEHNVLTTRESVARMTTAFMPQTRTQIGWRVIFDHSALDYERLPEAIAQAQSFEDTFILALEDAYGEDAPTVLVNTELAGALQGYGGEFDLLTAPFGVLLLQLGGLVMFFLVVMGALVRRSERREVSILQSRGARDRQLLIVYAVEGLMICVFGVVVGVPLARIFLVAFMPYLVGIDRLVLTIQPDAYVFASMAAAFALVVLVLTMIPVLNRPLVRAGGSAERSQNQAWWQRYYVDVVVLVIGVVALWQLVNNGVTGAQADPLLLLVPTLLFFALGSLSLRFFPKVMTFASALFSRRGDFEWAMAGWQVSREPVHYGRITLLLALAISIGWFAISFQNTVTDSTSDRAAYQVGADVRVEFERVMAAGIGGRVSALDGVERPVTTLRINDANMATSADSLMLETGRVLAVPPDFDDVAYWRDDLGELVVPRWDEPLPERGAVLPADTQALNFWLFVERYPSIAAQSGLPDDETVIPVFDPSILFDGSLEISLRVVDVAGTMYTLPVTYATDDWSKLVTEPVEQERFGDNAPPPLDPANMPDDGWINVSVSVEELDSESLRFEGIVLSASSPNQFSSAFAQPTILSLRDAVALTSAGDETTLDWFVNAAAWRFVSEVRAFGGFQPDPLSAHANTGGVVQVKWSQQQTTGRSALLFRYPEVTTIVVKDAFGADVVLASEAIGIPSVVSQSFADANDFEVGQKYTLFLDNVTLWFEVIAITDYYPTMYSDREQFVIVPDEVLLYALQTRPSSTLYHDEVWLRLADGVNGDEVAEALAVAPDLPSITTLSVYDDLLNTFQTDLLTAGLIGLLLLSFIVGLVLSIVSLMTYAGLNVQARKSEFAVLRALGFTRWRLVLSVTVEQSFVVLIALGLGVLIGLLLSTQVLPTLSNSTAGGALTPPFYVSFEAGTLILYCALILGVLVLALLLSAVLIRRLTVADTVRPGGE